MHIAASFIEPAPLPAPRGVMQRTLYRSDRRLQPQFTQALMRRVLAVRRHALLGAQVTAAVDVQIGFERLCRMQVAGQGQAQGGHFGGAEVVRVGGAAQAVA